MRLSALFLLPLLCSVVAAAQPAPPAQVSVVDQRIADARKRVQAHPESFQPSNELAFALCRKARDTGEDSLYTEAEDALKRSLQLSPNNYEAQKQEVEILLGRRDFTQALKRATDLNRKVRDDIAGWALLVDANAALGNYEEAERDAQWILDLRAGSALGFEKAAVLREIFGDPEGASEFLDETGRRTSQNDFDQRAWLLTQKARLALHGGNAKRAADLLAEALTLFPNSQLALAGLAEVRITEGNYQEAASILEKRYRAVPTTENLYAWADALARAGRKEEAMSKFRTFESEARPAVTDPHNFNLQLVSFYSDYKNDPSEALNLATEQVAARHDYATLDAYAWALYRSGKFSEAKVQLDKVLAVGIRTPAIFCHAARISAGVNDNSGAARFQKEISGLPANFCSPDLPIQSASGVTR